MNKKGVDALETLGLFILASVSFVLILLFFTKSGLFTGLLNFLGPTFTTAGSYIRGVPIYMLWAMYDTIMLVPGMHIEEATYGGISDSFTSIQNSIPLMSISVADQSYGYNKDCSKGTYPSDTFIKTVAARTLDCWNMYTAGRLNPLTGTEPIPRTCFVMQFTLNQSISFNDILNYINTAKVNRDNTYIQQIQSTSEHSKVIVENNKDGADLDKQMRKGVLFINYGDYVTDTFDNGVCTAYTPPENELTCILSGDFGLQELADSIASATEDEGKRFWDQTPQETMSDIESTSSNILSGIGGKTGLWEPVPQSTDFENSRIIVGNPITGLFSISNTWDEVTGTVSDLGDCITSAGSDCWDEDVVGDVLQGTFDLSNIEDAADNALDNMHFQVASNFKNEGQPLYKLNIRCYLEDTPMRGDIQIKAGYLRYIFVNGIIGWDDLDCNFPLDKFSVSAETFSVDCSIKNPELFDVLLTKPDHIFLCIDEDATYDGNCQPFKWS